MKKSLVFVMMLMVFVACGPKQRVMQKVQGGDLPAKVAILPCINVTNDILGGFVIRNLVHKELTEKYKNYEVQDIVYTDEMLATKGITDGALLGALNNLEICQLLGVDGLIYVDVYDMGMKILPFYHSRYVDFQVRMFNFNRLVWQKPVNIANRVMDLDGAMDAINQVSSGDYKSALENAGTSVGVQALVKVGVATLMEHELKPEFLMGIEEVYRALPYGNSENMKYRKKAEEKLAILNAQKEKEEVLTLGDEVEAEEVLVDVGETGLTTVLD